MTETARDDAGHALDTVWRFGSVRALTGGGTSTGWADHPWLAHSSIRIWLDSTHLDCCYPPCRLFAILITMKTQRRKTSFEVDFAKVDRAKAVLGTSTLTDTVDAALDEVMALQHRRDLVDLLFTNDHVDLDDPEIMAGAWR